MLVCQVASQQTATSAKATTAEAVASASAFAFVCVYAWVAWVPWRGQGGESGGFACEDGREGRVDGREERADKSWQERGAGCVGETVCVREGEWVAVTREGYVAAGGHRREALPLQGVGWMGRGGRGRSG